MKIEPYVKDRDGSAELRVHCQPRASKTEIVGLHGNALKVRLVAPPVEDQANIELCQFLAQHFGVLRQEVQIFFGKRGKQKRVLIKGKTAHEIQDCLTHII